MKVLITGATHGIGEHTAYHFAKDKAELFLTYNVAKDRVEEVKNKCLSLGAKRVKFFQLDLRSNDSIKALGESLSEIDILINNAGVISWKNLEDQSFEEIENQLRANLEGLIKLTKVLLPKMKKRIVNIASGAGKTGYAGLSVYCASKFGVRGFSQSLRQELAGKIDVVVVNPGMTKTRMTNFQGDPVEKVAEVVFKAAKGEIRPDEFGDVDVWENI